MPLQVRVAQTTTPTCSADRRQRHQIDLASNHSACRKAGATPENMIRRTSSCSRRPFIRPTFRGSLAAVASRAVDAAAVDARAFFLVEGGSRCGNTVWGCEGKHLFLVSPANSIKSIHGGRNMGFASWTQRGRKRKEEEGRGPSERKEVATARHYKEPQPHIRLSRTLLQR